MWWRIASALVGAGLLAWSNVDRVRLNPDRVLDLLPNGRVAQFRRPPVLVFLGIVLLVVGCASLQVVIGTWAFGLFAVLVAVATTPVLLHNRAVRRRT